MAPTVNNIKLVSSIMSKDCSSTIVFLTGETEFSAHILPYPLDTDFNEPSKYFMDWKTKKIVPRIGE